MAEFRSNMAGALSVNEGDDQIAQGSQDLGRLTAAQTRAVLPKGDIPHIVQAVFNAPMAAVQLEEPTGRGQGGRQIGDEVDDLLSALASALDGDGARKLGHLLHQWPVRTQVVMEARS